tara:strand:+ start:80 stop:670 length:591 start_codon:yes stop_codon:yes gene_type:complete
MEKTLSALAAPPSMPTAIGERLARSWRLTALVKWMQKPAGESGGNSMPTHTHHTMKYKYICRTPNSYGVSAILSEAFGLALERMTVAPSRMRPRPDSPLGPSDYFDLFRVGADAEVSIDDMGTITSSDELCPLELGDTDDGELLVCFKTLAYEGTSLKPFYNLAEMLIVLGLDKRGLVAAKVEQLEEALYAALHST